MRRTMIVFVTTELYPFTSGGIGRVIGNILSTAIQEERDKIFILNAGEKINLSQFSVIYPGVQLINIEDYEYCDFDRAGRHYPPKWAFTDTIWHWKSVYVMQVLRNLEINFGSFEYIEFPDWGGLAFSTVQEKLLGLAFVNSIIGVRLHSTDSILASLEDRHIDSQTLCLHDLERKSLADCDLVIAHLPDIADKIKSFYGFTDSIWNDKILIQSCPVVIDGTIASSSSTINEYTPIVFSSKIQSFKRPEVFIRGCVGFLRERPTYQGSIMILAHAFDMDYLNRVKQLIPEDLKNRFVFDGNASSSMRNKIISRSICIFPTIYESFCLAAYEASMMGALCILNFQNPAFGEKTPWKDNINCLKFDGTVEGLKNILINIFDDRPIFSIVDSSKKNNFLKLIKKIIIKKNILLQELNEEEYPLVSIIIPYFNLGSYILRTLKNVFDSTYPKLEVIVIDDGSTDSLSIEIINKLETLLEPKIRVIRNGYNRGLAATRNVGLKHAKGSYVLTLDADDFISSTFIEIAVNALKYNKVYDFVVTQAAYFNDIEENVLEKKECYNDYAIFLGEARTIGLYQNRFSTATVLARKDVLTKLGYREELEAYEDWDLYLRALTNGHRMLVTNDVQFFYRKRENSMIHARETRVRHKILHQALLRGVQSSYSYINFPLYTLNLQFNMENKNEEVINQLNLENQSLKKELDQVLHSKSMAITYPLRKASKHIPSFLKKWIWRFLKGIYWIITPQKLPERLRSFRNDFLLKKKIKKNNYGIFFNKEWYCKQYSDINPNLIDPIYHYFKFGYKEGRDPSPYFNTNWYLSQNPDVAESGSNPLQHFIDFGFREGRNPLPQNIHLLKE